MEGKDGKRMGRNGNGGKFWVGAFTSSAWREIV